ncbi:HEPN domain-containing protein [Clostridium oryzae]|uniref:HEPN domain protein n=1 Tax=Clostridium oryzae TaxID=1450648 RepID=A0A1V4IL48_9CLOT|nr:HEPN domain-containing protein [Clostridium oryzae]OPJ60560.1 HEPN domain protein [Clostridium oryzae]
MDKQELINYWIETSNEDFNTMLHLFESNDYHWSLFMGHLVIEKLLKAVYILNVNSNVPKIHDLLRLAEKANLTLTDEIQDQLDTITTFNISARYPDYKKSFYKKCTYEFTSLNIEKIKELRQWILSLLTVK